MPSHLMDVPDVLPVLSRGKHRNPRKGACFMELASFLAGERWSDHPKCTHPLLGSMARLVNDYTSDAGRSRLAVLIPSVIGVTGDDLRIDARIALRAALSALPVAAAERQRAMAVSVLAAERMLAELEGRPADSLSETSVRALAQAPHAARWARRFAPGIHPTQKRFRKHAAPTTVQYAVEGIARACVAYPDDLLHDLLSRSIDDCRTLIRSDTPDTADQPEFDKPAWAAACRLTVRSQRRITASGRA